MGAPHHSGGSRPYCQSGDSRNPESFVQFLAGSIKDSGLRIQSGVAIERPRGKTNPRRHARRPHSPRRGSPTVTPGSPHRHARSPLSGRPHHSGDSRPNCHWSGISGRMTRE